MITAELTLPESPPPPPAEITVRSTEGHGSWQLTESEARQMYAQLGNVLSELDRIRSDRMKGGMS